MKNFVKSKKFLICIFSFCLMFCVTLAFLPHVFSAKAIELTLTTYKMAHGAEMRIAQDGTSGIRFTASVSKGEFDNITNNQGINAEGFEFGMLIAKGNFASTAQAKEFLINNKENTKIAATSGKYSLNDNEFKYSVAIYNVKDNEKSFAALGYITVGKTTYYANVENEGDNIRSLYDVAVGYTRAIANGDINKNDINDDAVTYAESIIEGVKGGLPIYTATDFMKIGKSERKFVLMNDITIKVNGIESVEEGSDAIWTMYDVGNKRYSLLDTFNGVLDGNGYKITLINTTPVEGAEFSGLFRALGANSVVKNTVFDIQIAQSNSGGYILCAYTYGTINDCVIKVKYAGANAKVFRQQLVSGCVNNVIFDLSNTNITALFNSSVFNTSVNNIIVTGQGAYNASNIVNYSGTRGSGVIYTSHADAVTSENFGYDMDKKAMATKLDFGNEGSWTFDYVNHEIKLCGKTVLDKYSDYTQISTVSDFMKIDDSIGKFVLTNDITIKVDGVDAVKDGCDAPWTNYDIRENKFVSLLGEFKGVLDGNGYKVTIVSETGVSDLSVMFGGVFADIAKNAVIKNTVFDIQIATIKNVSGGIHIFCGWVRGTVEDCYIKVGRSQGHGSGLRVIRGTDGVSGTMNNVILDLLGATNVTELTYKPENVKNISNVIMIGTTITYSSNITNATKCADYESVFKTPLTGESWTFDVENKEIKLCGKTVLLIKV